MWFDVCTERAQFLHYPAITRITCGLGMPELIGGCVNGRNIRAYMHCITIIDSSEMGVRPSFHFEWIADNMTRWSGGGSAIPKLPRAVEPVSGGDSVRIAVRPCSIVLQTGPAVCSVLVPIRVSSDRIKSTMIDWWNYLVNDQIKKLFDKQSSF